jgi:hypothetical protein
MRKSFITAAVLSLATAGSVMLGGTALAWGGEDTGGAGTGGTATNNCLNVGAPIIAGNGVIGQGTAVGASCNASANGTGGNAD